MLTEYVEQESEFGITNERDLTHLQHVADRAAGHVTFSTLVTWFEKPERCADGLPFPVADAILCATGKVDLWRGVLAEFYENVDMTWVQCESPACDRWFRQGRVTTGPTVKRYCSKACSDATTRLQRGEQSTIRKNYGGGGKRRKSNKCRNGHERTPESTKIRKNGKMECLLCHRESAKAAYRRSQERKGIAPRVTAGSTGPEHGMPLTVEENIRLEELVAA